MKAWTIFAHSWRQVFGNLGDALRLSVGPFLLAQAASYAIGLHRFTDQESLQMAIRRGDLSVGALFVVAFVGLVTSLWIAVSWHRFVLTEERGGLLPPFHADRILGYFGKSVLIGLIVVVPALVLLFIASGLLGAIARGQDIAAIMSPGGQMLIMLFVLIMLLPVFIMATRLSVMLPGTALKADVPVWSGWEATKGQSLVIAGVILLTLGLNLLMELPLLLIQSELFAMIWGVVIAWVLTMVSVSLLTTLYGHYVEKRALL